MKPESWGLFHDGTIDGIEGKVPGNIDLSVSIQYLRRMFPGESDHFRVALTGCTKFTFTPYGEPAIDSLSDILKQEPEILYVTSLDPLVLDCATGKLEMAYDEAAIRLDSGEHIEDETLTVACRKYWDRL